MKNDLASDLEATITALLASGKGILAADESFPTIGKRFAALDIPATEEHRRAYRETLFTTPGLGEFISGAILFDETLRQRTAAGLSFPQALARQGIVPGIKVDQGTIALANFPGQRFTEGLAGLSARLAAYRKLGARFTKWRAVITIDGRHSTAACIEANAGPLAQFAALSQKAGLVPIVEPEVLMDGNHTLARCEEVMGLALQTVFAALLAHRVARDHLLLKTGMVLPGKDCSSQAGPGKVADATIRCLRRAVPAAVPGIVFLSGGQSAAAATERLNAICQAGGTPWALSFSFGRALQDAAMKTWAGAPANAAAAQAVLLQRARDNSLAVQGRFSAPTERKTTARDEGSDRDRKTLPVPAHPNKSMKTTKSSNNGGTVRPAKKTPRPQDPLVSSPAQVKRESARLRRGRESLESTATTAETDIRTSLI